MRHVQSLVVRVLEAQPARDSAWGPTTTQQPLDLTAPARVSIDRERLRPGTPAPGRRVGATCAVGRPPAVAAYLP